MYILQKKRALGVTAATVDEGKILFSAAREGREGVVVVRPVMQKRVGGDGAKVDGKEWDEGRRVWELAAAATEENGEDVRAPSAVYTPLPFHLSPSTHTVTHRPNRFSLPSAPPWPHTTRLPSPRYWFWRQLVPGAAHCYHRRCRRPGIIISPHALPTLSPPIHPP